jgi:hypothetical protein
MAYDQNTRNRLQRFVNDARNLLSGEFTRQFQQKYGMDPVSGEVSEMERLLHLDDRELEIASMLRDTLAHYLASSPSAGQRDCLERMIREQAFTVLNRLCALRMAEAREIIIESLARTYNSKGFQLYAHLSGTAMGETGDAYRIYLFSLFDELALDLPVLFDRFSPQGQLFPGEGALLQLLALMNEADLIPLWVEDETIGWIYQYFNTQDERRQMRAESQAPRNSRELAVRNQFFTPRYVVEFLTDNTLGRLWYEMTRGETRLKHSCSYLVRRPQEIFLASGEEAPEQENSTDDLSQEELLQQPVYIPHRPLKDPRDILMLDPACGSMHFGLYAFDIYERIYQEAWELETQLGPQVFERSENLQPLQQSYASREEFMRYVPRLIIEYNIHGVDIDPRAVQIAGLSLWLRAQRSWLDQGIKAQQRPRIRKSNVVCAEPMPGEKTMLEEFASKLKPKVLGQLVKIIFEKMQLAGEAGSLLKIEEEIEEALNLAREEFQKELQLRQEESQTLFPDMLPPRQGSIFDFTDLVDKTRFWNYAEEKLLEALRKYAEEAEGTEAVQKRLFAQDAARGFAFIDLFRKKYDVVLMNPPFGEIGIKCQDYFNKYYSDSKNIICSFINQAGLYTNGFIGVVIDRSILMRNSYENFRKSALLDNCMLRSVVDLGWNVLDANVEVSLLILSSNNKHVCGTELLNEIDKEKSLLEGIKYPFWMGLKVFSNMPFSVINFNLPTYLKSALKNYPIITKIGQFYNGHTIKSDVFKRLRWELSYASKWRPMWNGSEYSPYHVSSHEAVLWEEYAGGVENHSSTIIRNPDKNRKSGLCYGKRGDYLDVQILPEGHVLTNEGFGGPFKDELETWFLLGYLNSRAVQIALNYFCGQHKGVGYVNKLPMPLYCSQAQEIGEKTKSLFNTLQGIRTCLETTPLFISPRLLGKFVLFKASLKDFANVYANQKNEIHYQDNQIESSVYALLNITEKEKVEITQISKGRAELQPISELITTPNGVVENRWYSHTIIGYLFGCIFGRWDIRYTTGEKEPPELPDPFAPLPVCPPGMLQNEEGLPASPQDVPDYYPLQITWSGILLDDEGQADDIVARVREAIEVIWKDKAGDIELEACEILGVVSLRDYFRKPGNFFAEHLKRYSKSRRQAPIYWPLSTTSGSYTIWLYYQRLSDQTLYRCVNDYVEPKLKQVGESTRQLRQKSGRSRQEEEKLEELGNLELELREFRDELLWVAAFWKPNLNDGVQITAAPLWKLFRLPNWRKKLKETWEKLEKGDYDWAHLAYSIWPERVKEKCRNDKSLAIAHDLEELYVEPPARAKKKGRRGKKNI